MFDIRFLSSENEKTVCWHVCDLHATEGSFHAPVCMDLKPSVALVNLPPTRAVVVYMHTKSSKRLRM